MSLKNKLGASFRNHVDDTIGLFDSLVRPILLYGSDFWGCLKLPHNNPIENLHMHFCRQILGVQKNTSTKGVLLELGRTPLVHEARRLSIKNWERIRNQDGNILVTKSYENSCSDNLPWNELIKKLISEHGMMYKLSENSTTNIHNAIDNRAKDHFVQESFCEIAKPDSKLRTYSLIKNTFQREDYLTNIRNTKQRQNLTKLRLSNHKLRIETGRHDKLPKEQRTCELCNNGIEDEIHFMVSCPELYTLRKPLLESCHLLKPQFGFYTDQQKFIYIMTTPALSSHMLKFLDSASKDRDTFLESKATLDCLLSKVCKN